MEKIATKMVQKATGRTNHSIHDTIWHVESWLRNHVDLASIQRAAATLGNDLFTIISMVSQGLIHVLNDE